MTHLAAALVEKNVDVGAAFPAVGIYSAGPKTQTINTT